jgi:hypothetical protein
MSIHDMRKSKFCFFAVLAALALATAPAWAKASAPPASGDSLTQVVSETPPPAAPVQLDPSLAMATASVGADGLSSFGSSSGTVVGNRALALRDEVLRLRSSVNLNSNEFAILRSSGAAGAVQYHSTVAAITARLQNGTTKGNPILLRQWEEADASLNEVSSSLTKLNSLEVSVDADASVASYLLDSVQAAYNLSGAIDEDHDQLKMLHDEVSRLVVQLDYLRNQTTADIQRQSSYMATERANIQALAFAISRGEMLGNSLANRSIIVNHPSLATLPSTASNAQSFAPLAAPAAPVTQGAIGEEFAAPPMDNGGGAAMPTAPSIPSNASSAPPTGHLLVLIRYNQPHVEYEQQLSQAVGTAIERRPNAEFSIVAVSPTSGDPAVLAEQQQLAKSSADDVKRSLVQLGLSPSRITMANTQSKTAQTPEVHVYIR